MPTLQIDQLSRTEIVRYLGASGDFNPLHHSDEFVKQGGQDGVIAPGMLIAGIASSALTQWVPVRTVTRFRTRFVNTVRPGDSLIVTGKVSKIDSDNGEMTAEVDISVENADGTVVLDGDATIRH
ncbi:MaoC family dehydratase [Halostagnicola kamekurae]|uniref:MaoC family dehydratase n=1 Tax=Halostagnicola kamekurae TaxID=619731 RepID=UPI001587E69A|nr:MaoC/PaaZ C-terminal domain-containing protein [Halostagnicola kamekurae]